MWHGGISSESHKTERQRDMAMRGMLGPYFEVGRTFAVIRKAALASCICLALGLAMVPGQANAQIADPDSLTFESVNAFDGVINTGDLLILVRYRIDFAVLPNLAVSDAFVGRFFASSVEVNASEILAFQDLGYGTGIFSFYFTEAEKTAASIEFNNPNSELYEVVVQGKPSAFTDPPTVTTATITFRSTTNTRQQLITIVKALATTLQTDAAWVANNILLLDFVAGQEVLTGDGESYFAQSVPNLQVMIPALFGSSTTAPPVNERNFGFSERDRLGNFFTGTSIDTAFESAADTFEVDKILITSIVGLILVGFFVVLANGLTGSPEFGLFSLAFTYPLAATIGLGSLVAVTVVASIGVLGIGFVLFLRRAA